MIDHFAEIFRIIIKFHVVESVLLAMAGAARGRRLERADAGAGQCGVRHLPGEADVTEQTTSWP